MSGLAQQPYFLRALYEWCVDSGYTPYITVRVDASTRVPPSFVKDGQIVLNIGPSAVRNLHMDNEWVTFSARFSGVSQDIQVPVTNVLAIYARESGEGMAFPEHAVQPREDGGEPVPSAIQTADAAASGQDDSPDKPKGRPTLRLVK